jgi:hypothetical protein
MPRSLPSRPSLAHLKHQAKDLRIAAREGDVDAIAILRRIKRFAHAADHEVAAARVSLSEAQFALALEYGFANWSELKQRVELQRGSPGRAARRADGAIIIEGLENVRWGNATRRQCSSIATLSLVSERVGDEIDYDYLMAASGAAFRVQMSEGVLCASSPHAACGFDCAKLALQAWGHEIVWLATGDGHEAERDAARARVTESIDRGVPVLYEAEESSLIAGYTDETLLIRSYFAKQPGYDAMERWPWLVGIASETGSRPEIRRVIADSLRLATQLFETPKVDRYTCGRAAYRHWAELLTDQAAFEKMTDQECFGAALGNAHSFDCLADARGCAANFLAGMADELDPEAQRPLRQAAEKYGDLEISLRAQRRELAPYPWELPNVRAWPAELRQREADALAEIGERDAEAIRLLERALTALEVSRVERQEDA